MGREIRRVPKNWQHPVNEHCGHRGWGGPPHNGGPCYKPMLDEDYDTAAQKWIADLVMWENGSHPGRAKSDTRYFWDYENMPPNEEYHRPAFDGPADCYQIYETVSEGTPVSPVFETLDELVAWLVSKGHDEKAARRFAESGWAPSMMVYSPGNGQAPTIKMGIDSLGMRPDDET